MLSRRNKKVEVINLITHVQEQRTGIQCVSYSGSLLVCDEKGGTDQGTLWNARVKYCSWLILLSVFCIFKGLAAPPTGGTKAGESYRASSRGVDCRITEVWAENKTNTLKQGKSLSKLCSKERLFWLFKYIFVVTQAFDRPQAAPSNKRLAFAAPYRHKAVTK